MSGMEDMLKRIESQINGTKASEVTELNLDDCKSSGKVEGLSEEFSSLQNLSMINSGINSLKAFPKLLKLKKLELSDNHIGDSLSSLASCVSLTHLNLSGNKIESLDDLAPLADLKYLISLDLFNCAVTKLPDYRESVYKLIPSLEVLDGYNKNNEEVVDSDEEDENENGVTHRQVEKGDEASSANEKEEVNEEEDEGSEEESGDEQEYGLSYLERDDIEDDEDDGDYEEEDDEEDEEIEEEEEDAESGERAAKRRKLEEEES